MSEKLKNCPFCGGDARVCVLVSGRSTKVLCGECAASSPLVGKKVDAIAAWNRRIEPARGGEGQ